VNFDWKQGWKEIFSERVWSAQESEWRRELRRQTSNSGLAMLTLIADFYEDEPMNEKQTIIEPTVGRLLYVYSRSKTFNGVHIEGPMAGIVVAVHSTRCINVSCINSGGTHVFYSSLALRQPGDQEPPSSTWAEWMPEQVKMAREREHTQRSMAQANHAADAKAAFIERVSSLDSPNKIVTNADEARKG
jgi:hypothetical protein